VQNDDPERDCLLGEHPWNRRRIPLEELAKHPDKHVAFTLDGKRILADGDTIEEVEERLLAVGIHPRDVVWSFIECRLAGTYRPPCIQRA